MVLEKLIEPIKSHFVLFNLGLAVVFSIALMLLLGYSPYCPDTPDTKCTLDFSIIFWALVTFFCAGGLGGVVCNLRGIFEYYMKNGNLPETYFVPYVVRPWMGAGCGLITFFVLSFLNTALSSSGSLAWTTLPGRIPYLGLAIVAGFGSHEFMERLKEIAKSAFAIQTSGPKPDDEENGIENEIDEEEPRNDQQAGSVTKIDGGSQ